MLPFTGRTPTAATSETPVGIARESMPWESGASEGKYRYHPGGNPANAPKDAPSAVNVVVIPDVNLPKVRDEPLPRHRQAKTPIPLTTLRYSTCTTSTTNGARTATRCAPAWFVESISAYSNRQHQTTVSSVYLHNHELGMARLTERNLFYPPALCAGQCRTLVRMTWDCERIADAPLS